MKPKNTLAGILKNAARGVVATEKSNPLNMPQAKKKSRYGNVKKIVDGITFHSTKEADRYIDLSRMQKAGDIRDLKLQVHYELNPGGTFSYQYVADFVYFDVLKRKQIVEDVKPKPDKNGKVFLKLEFKKKAKLMKQVHNIDVEIV